MYKKFSLLLGALLLVAGCSIQQTVEPSSVSTGGELCIVENSAVREGFLAELQSSLAANGVHYKVLPANSSLVECEWTATYTARWTWDLALYMSFAEIKVYRNGAPDGSAVYDSTRGGANMSKFIDAETKIRELVDQLLQKTALLKAIENENAA
ncbi:Sbal_3080 family lipoprotein [uncultured Microbulbifer sp.]|uniref:Sbal_3080 family lipoprotein n=1 Tax=uncultured Microbulbifer sp. TaxID=348147 RepID=UPI0025F4DC90|nr:Sbal_3080 family lipoprotein [uncultured Microbulbifer sp.]